ncbi:hypothetical protein [Sphingomonas taxi]|uniref:hypothetical protein n=1 Tax=Sphingomonas taxi TaxID=1549858 RepID=UPI001FE0D12A|nr:hypothetical protein [Sphingomonas taxi]
MPADLVAALDLHEGDDVTIGKIEEMSCDLSEAEKDALVARMKSLARPLPPGFKFDREEANSR